MDSSDDHLLAKRKKTRKPVFSEEILFAPVFFGCLLSLFSTVLIAGRTHPLLLDGQEAKSREIRGEDKPTAQSPAGMASGAVLKPQRSANTRPAAGFVAEEHPENIRFFAQKKPEQRDLIQELYRQPEYRERVIEFFAEICPSRDIAEAILTNANLYDIPPALALALAWEESRLNPRAVNDKNRNESIDRGLFQLNDRTFPQLEIPSFFNPGLNAMYGMSHLRHCLNTGGTEIAALAMYNAGTVRVQDTGTPKTTLDYVSRILENRSIIEYRFQEREGEWQQPSDLAEAQPERQRLVPLIPLAGK
ncbi:MAG: transglycosylase SLT domain-containing protein [Treponema sp.]|jgi:hypothetical protein|nr:transglycosylase SLT domain-containing protein [Treponema sp.]